MRLTFAVLGMLMIAAGIAVGSGWRGLDTDESTARFVATVLIGTGIVDCALAYVWPRLVARRTPKA
jgi:hypothetical protein